MMVRLHCRINEEDEWRVVESLPGQIRTLRLIPTSPRETIIGEVEIQIKAEMVADDD